MYTSTSYFDCKSSKDFELKTDRQKIIYHLLEKAVVTEKDIPDYGLHKNKSQFYVLNKEIKRINKAPFYDYVPLAKNEMPTKIGAVSFCWKTQNELQTIADETNDFLYLSLGEIQINGNKASVRLNNEWITSEKNKGKYTYMSGGGYELPLIKEDNEWIIDRSKEMIQWIS